MTNNSFTASLAAQSVTTFVAAQERLASDAAANKRMIVQTTQLHERIVQHNGLVPLWPDANQVQRNPRLLRDEIQIGARLGGQRL